MSFCSLQSTTQPSQLHTMTVLQYCIGTNTLTHHKPYRATCLSLVATGHTHVTVYRWTLHALVHLRNRQSEQPINNFGLSLVLCTCCAFSHGMAWRVTSSISYWYSRRNHDFQFSIIAFCINRSASTRHIRISIKLPSC